MKRKTDIAYLTDLFTKFNMVNLQLQGDSLNLIKTKSILSAFLARVKLMKQNIGRGEFSLFPNLSQTSCQEDDVSTHVQHLNALYSDLESMFEDILTMVIPPWIINPYGDIEETNVIIQEELTELSTNEELKVQFKNGYQQFWLQNNIPVTYPIEDEETDDNEILSKASANANNPEGHNECQIFGNLVAKKLAKYSPELPTNTQQAIMNILFKADSIHIRQNSSNFQSPPQRTDTIHSFFSNYQANQESCFNQEPSQLSSPTYSYGNSNPSTSTDNNTPLPPSLPHELLDMSHIELQSL
ncbi:unnamed protein product [Acanthoscelides obtectus]|uniref:Uncharacterized protein n=1 Tax=Acanthoscelides obtectus TaxID=200917 RepID=A0A9P0KK54_ACAOB|nr:unnamed protein product [Acanthoscelides obtectus]CAK1642684.1 Zinc finger BED domain-containing protein 5 [Acanthoscelides obtectus]